MPDKPGHLSPESPEERQARLQRVEAFKRDYARKRAAVTQPTPAPWPTPMPTAMATAMPTPMPTAMPTPAAAAVPTAVPTAVAPRSVSIATAMSTPVARQKMSLPVETPDEAAGRRNRVAEFKQSVTAVPSPRPSQPLYERIKETATRPPIIGPVLGDIAGEYERNLFPRMGAAARVAIGAAGGVLSPLASEGLTQFTYKAVPGLESAEAFGRKKLSELPLIGREGRLPLLDLEHGDERVYPKWKEVPGAAFRAVKSADKGGFTIDSVNKAAAEYGQDVGDPPGYWGGLRLVAEVFVPYLSALGGKGLLTKQPAISRAFEKFAAASPARFRPAVGAAQRAAEEATKITGKGAQVPWMAEEELGRMIGGAFRGIGAARRRVMGSRVVPDEAAVRRPAEEPVTTAEAPDPVTGARVAGERNVQETLEELNRLHVEAVEAQRLSDATIEKGALGRLGDYDPISIEGFKAAIPKIMGKLVRNQELTPDELFVWNKYKSVLDDPLNESQRLRKQQIDIVEEAQAFAARRTDEAKQVAPVPTAATGTPEEVVEQILDDLGFTSTPERMTKEWPFGKVPGQDLAAGVTGAPLRGQRQLASTTRATRKGVELEIRERKKTLNDMRIAKRRSAGLGTKRKVLAKYERAIEFQEEEIKRLENRLIEIDAMPVPYQPVPRGMELERLGEIGSPGRARNDLVQAIRKLEPRYIAEERERILPGILRKYGSTESEYLLLQRATPGIDYFDVDRLAREAVDKRLAAIRKAGEKRIDEIEARFREKLIGRPPRKRPPQREQARPIQEAEEVPVRAEPELTDLSILGLPKGPVEVKPFRWWQTATNMAESILLAPARKFTVRRKNAIVQAIMDSSSRATRIGRSQSANISARIEALAASVFKFDKAGRIPELKGIDSSFAGAPTLQDVAARLPVYQPRLSAQQIRVMREIKDDMKLLSDFYPQLDVPLGIRPDIMDGGFYMPRGRTTKDGLEADWAIGTTRLKRAAEPGYAKSAKFMSQSEGIDAGYIYPPLRETLRTHINDVFSRTVEKHTVDSFKALEEAGVPLGQPLKKTADGKFTVPEGRATITLPGLEGRSFPAELARAANEVIEEMGPGSMAEESILLVNNMYRFTRATMDNSGPGIQGLLALGSKPIVFNQAMKVNIRAWGKGGDKALGRGILQFDANAKKTGRLTSRQLISYGVHQGGEHAEMTIGGDVVGFMGKLANMPLIRQANRAYGYFGDMLRLWWADDILRGELAKGRTIKELVETGEMSRIADAVNNATGYSKTRTLGKMGDLLVFAPRFLQSRLTTLTRAGIGAVRTPAGWGEELARASGIMKKGKSTPFRTRTPSRLGPNMEQRIARDSIMKLIGSFTVLTFMANEMLGNETDTRMFVNGRYNSNFMRIRWQGRDWTLFGHWDSLLRAIVVTAQGRPQDAIRGMGSGVVANAWDFISGESFIGERVRDNPLQFARRMLQNFIPFAAEDIIGEGWEAVEELFAGQGEGPLRTIGKAGSAMTGEVGGFKSAPTGMGDARDDEARILFSDWFSNLEPYQQDVVDATEAVTSKREEALEDPWRPQDPTGWSKISDDQLKDYWALSDMPGTLTEITRKYNGLQKEYRGRRVQAGIGVEFKDPKNPTAGERALLEFYDIYEMDTVKLGEALIDYDEFEKQLKKLKREWAKNNQGQWQYVLRNTNTRPIPDALHKRLHSYTKQRIHDSRVAREIHLRKIGREDLIPRAKKAFLIPGKRPKVVPSTPTQPLYERVKETATRLPGVGPVLGDIAEEYETFQKTRQIPSRLSTAFRDWETAA